MASNPVRVWRDQLDLTQERAARELGVTLRTVQHWESGSVQPPLIALLLMTAIADHGPQEAWAMGTKPKAAERRK